jgi:hypothetical protein
VEYKLEIPEGYEVKVSKKEIKAVGRARWEEAVDKGEYKKLADYGRQYVYRSERAALKTIPATIVDLTIEQLKSETNRIFSDVRVIGIDPFPREKVFVENSVTRGANARAYERRMRFGAMKDNMTLLHEIAHILTPGQRHNHEFCRVFCLLVEWFHGIDAGNHLRSYMGE